jgi:hypothetical protein
VNAAVQENCGSPLTRGRRGAPQFRARRALASRTALCFASEAFLALRRWALVCRSRTSRCAGVRTGNGTGRPVGWGPVGGAVVVVLVPGAGLDKAGPHDGGNRPMLGAEGAVVGTIDRRFKVPETVPKFARLEFADAAT